MKQLAVGVPGGLAHGLAAAVAEGGELARVDIAQVAGDVHRLMVADEDDDPAAGLGRFLVQLLQMADDLQAVRPAVGDVAGLDEGRRSAGPAVPGVDDAGANGQCRSRRHSRRGGRRRRRCAPRRGLARQGQDGEHDGGEPRGQMRDTEAKDHDPHPPPNGADGAPRRPVCQLPPRQRVDRTGNFAIGAPSLPSGSSRPRQSLGLAP